MNARILMTLVVMLLTLIVQRSPAPVVSSTPATTPQFLTIAAQLQGDAPCVFRPSNQRFLCDTARDGGAAEFTVQFGVSGDIPLIGSLGQPFGVALPLVVR